MILEIFTNPGDSMILLLLFFNGHRIAVQNGSGYEEQESIYNQFSVAVIFFEGNNIGQYSGENNTEHSLLRDTITLIKTVCFDCSIQKG